MVQDENLLRKEMVFPFITFASTYVMVMRYKEILFNMHIFMEGTFGDPPGPFRDRKLYILTNG